jgi:hypothetical protein
MGWQNAIRSPETPHTGIKITAVYRFLLSLYTGTTIIEKTFEALKEL